MNIVLPYKFNPYKHQLELLSAFDKGYRRFNIVWHRRAGKDCTAMALLSKVMVQQPATYWHVLPTFNQGRKVIWDGKDEDGEPMISRIPKELYARDPNISEMKVEVMCPPDKKTGNNRTSIYQVVGGDTYDGLVGTNPAGIIFSEWSVMDPLAWQYFRPIIVKNGGWAMFIYTPRGHNHAWKMHNAVKEDPEWFTSVRTVTDTGLISEADIEKERRAGAPEELINQEYYCSFEGATVGGVYVSEMRQMRKENRIREMPYDPRYRVHTAWDLGIRDDTVILFVQEYENWINVIDFYRANETGLGHYAKVVHSKPYVYGNHYFPWDIKNRQQGVSVIDRRKVLSELGIHATPAKRTASLEDGIALVRRIFPKLRIDRVKCFDLVGGLDSYRMKYDSVNDVFKGEVSDWACHIADALRTYAAGRSEIQEDRSKTFGDFFKQSKEWSPWH